MIKLFDPYIAPDAWKYVKETLSSTYINEGKMSEQFKKELQPYGLHNTHLVNSCTSALHLALLLAGVHKGDEVILPAQTFVATGLAVLYVGATPVFADIDKRGLISTDDVGRKITKKTKAIMCVDWGGLPANLICLKSFGLPVIEDAAHSLGAYYGDKMVGTIADYTCFSFQAIKTLTTVDGGALCTTHPHAELLKWFGMSKKRKPSVNGERSGDIELIGYKYNFNDVSASIGLANIKSLRNRLMRRREIAKRYNDAFRQRHSLNSSFWLYPLIVKKRNAFILQMKRMGVETSVVHRGIDRYSIFREYRTELPVQRWFDKHQVNIPIHDNLSDRDVDYITSCVLKLL
jgi:perosamine synthetase